MLRQFWDKMTAPTPGEGEGGGVNGESTASSTGRAVLEPRSSQEFVVVGLGRFGTSLARTLVKYGYTVLAIDRSQERVQQLSGTLPYVVQLDATNVEALRQAGVDGFDTAVVCIGDDFESNLLATVQLRKLGVKRVLAKARTNTQKDILVQVGADEVVLPEHEAGVRLGRRLASGHFVDYLEVADDVGIVELIAPRSLIGLTLAQADIRGRFGLSVIAVQREDGITVSPPADFAIAQGDILVVLGRIDAAEQLTD
jgi:trk system potassium uptake protein TrkA